MTQTTTPATSTARTVSVEESFSRYRFDADAVSGRTDTPDLMETFRQALSDVADGYKATNEAAAEAHADLADASFKTLPDW